jgi:hypothetical protein
LRRNPFIGIANGNKKKGSFENKSCCHTSSTYQAIDTSLCHKGHQLVRCERRHLKTGEAVLKQAGAVLLQRQSHAAYPILL